MNKRFYNPSLTVLFFGVNLAFYLSMVIWLDNTNIVTTNGLYKSIDVMGWEKGNRFGVDSGGLLYAISIGLLAKLIPESWVNFYGIIVTDFTTYRKLAYLHSLFGALSSTVVLILANLITKDRLWSVLVAVLHAISAFIWVNSVTSEDIMPGYFFFCLSFLFFYQALTTEHKRFYLTLTTLSILGTIFLHWTLFPPLVCTYGTVGLWYLIRDQRYVRLFLEQLLVLCAPILIFIITANKFFGVYFKHKIRFFDVLYPPKAGPGLWVGLSWHKLESLYLGIGNFLVGGENLVLLHNATKENLIRTVFSWIATLGALSLVIRGLKKNQLQHYRLLAGMGLEIFLFGQLQNLYGQPQDPQFQVQPMFILMIGAMLLGVCYSKSKILKTLLTVVVLLVGQDNFSSFNRHRGVDSHMVKGFQEFRQLFPKDQIKLVQLDYGGWSTWLMYFNYKNWGYYLQDTICLNTIFHSPHKINFGKEAGKIFKEEIDKSLNEGKRVIATTPWVNSDHIYGIQVQNITKDQVEDLKTFLLNQYRIKKTYSLLWGDFAEIEKK